MTKGQTENILCKVFRLNNGNMDDMFRDHLVHRQPLFEFHGDSVRVTYADGMSLKLEDESLLTRFPFGLSLLMPIEIARHMHLPIKYPAKTSSIDDFQLPRGITHPQVHCMVDFRIPLLGVCSVWHFRYRSMPHLFHAAMKDLCVEG